MNYKQLMWEHHHYRFGLAGEGQADTIQEYLDRERGRVLNLGCGPSPDHIRNLSHHCRSLVAVDHGKEMIAAASRGADRSLVSFVVADAYSLPFSVRAFDHVVDLGLFAYIRNPKQVFNEFARVLRPNGKVMLTNSVARPKDQLVAAAESVGFRPVHEAEGYCPAASGRVKRRYLLIFENGADSA